jgi:ADP-L-glycero-D-manno-heptose 6-epimerase
VFILRQKYEMIVITGAAGFIGSAFISYLNEKGIYNAVPADHFNKPSKMQNLAWKHHGTPVEASDLMTFLHQEAAEVSGIIHLGGKAGYFHQDWDSHKLSHLTTGQALWHFCTEMNIPFLFAGSGAVYGSGEFGFSDRADHSFLLKPEHPYTRMRLEFDNWALRQEKSPPFWASLRMFNVYGPNEYHKGENASIIYKNYNNILASGQVELFASHKREFPNGGMKRDFVYIKDVVSMIYHLFNQQPESGIYNICSGTSHSFLEAAQMTFKVLGLEERISFREMPESIRDVFPYNSEADISKLRLAGYQQPTVTLEDGIADYIRRFLQKGEYY